MSVIFVLPVTFCCCLTFIPLYLHSIISLLKTLCQDPSQDERVLPRLEALLNDTTPCITMLPYRFGEIRWLAAKALVAERAALGHGEPVRMHNVVRPFDTEEFALLAASAGVKSRGGVEGVLEALATLREMGELPLYDLELVPNVKNKQDKTIANSTNLTSSKGAKSEEVTQEPQSSKVSAS